MRVCLKTIAAAMAAFLLCAAQSYAQQTRATLHLSATSARPGDTVTAAVRLKMKEGWHTYWKNPGPGPTGKATRINWQLPEGITAGEIVWPTPEKFIPAKLDDDGNPIFGQLDYDQATYVYHGEIALIVPLKLSPQIARGKIEVKADVDWLECEIQCLPGNATVTATLQIADQATDSPDSNLIAAWQKQLPVAADATSVRATWSKTAKPDSRALIIESSGVATDVTVDFFPEKTSGISISSRTETLSTGTNGVTLRKVVTLTGAGWPKEISGVLVHTSDDAQKGFQTRLTIADAPGNADNTGPAGATNGLTLGMSLLYAFLGGMILNIMPCVLPVIALKILGFVGQAGESRARVRTLGLAYAAGVLVSFLALAALVIGLKAAGQSVGWGFQFSNPVFVILMTALITLVAMNLFGVFEINLGGDIAGAAGELAARHGTSGAFFNGMFATLLATPCTAPFLSPALGFAFAQPAALVVLLFSTVAAGLALPYVLLSWNPQWLKFLPKPGAWMEKFKIAMGFPMLATAIWLSKVGPEYYGERAWWLGIALVLIALAAWVFGEFIQRGSARKPLALAVIVALLAAAYFWALESNLEWRSPKRRTTTGETSLPYAPKGYDWKAWSPEAVAKARAEGRVVIVDFTAWWCGTCNTTVKPALGNKRVVEKLKELDAVALLADNSDSPPQIVEELKRFGRAGVPMVLVYPRKGEPSVLPDPGLFPAQYVPVILNALEKAK